MKLTKQGVRLFMAFLTSVGFFSVLGALLFFNIPEQNKDVFNIFAGFLGGAFTQGIIGFYFGDSDSRGG